MADEKTRPECNHEHGWPTSTVEVERIEEARAWAARCSSCRRTTEACATLEEAVERARRGWWAM